MSESTDDQGARGPAAGEGRRRPAGEPFGRVADLVAGLMMLGFSAVAYLYAAKVANLDPITIWPFALWAGSHVALGVVLSPLLRARRAMLVVGYGVLLGLLLSEEPLYIARSLWHDPVPDVRQAAADGRRVRVISVNCGGGDVGAVEDALAHTPDIILLQEMPAYAELDEVLPPDWSRSGRRDCSVLVKGSLIATPHPKWLAHQLQAVLAIPLRTGRPIAVISTHLVQPSLRADIWRPSIWRKARRLREARGEAIAEALEQRARYGDNVPAIIGGDFNTRAGDSLLQPLARAGMTDAFRAVGTGWPNTFTARFPLERIDFIWADDRFEPLRAVVAVSGHSDHRMVVADLAVK